MASLDPANDGPPFEPHLGPIPGQQLSRQCRDPHARLEDYNVIPAVGPLNDDRTLLELVPPRGSLVFFCSSLMWRADSLHLHYHIILRLSLPSFGEDGVGVSEMGNLSGRHRNLDRLRMVDTVVDSLQDLPYP